MRFLRVIDYLYIKNMRGKSMSEKQRGLCKDCKRWQIELEATIGDATTGFCLDEELQPYQLLVSDASGCNKFSTGTPARAVGSASKLSTVKAIIDIIKSKLSLDKEDEDNINHLRSSPTFMKRKAQIHRLVDVDREFKNLLIY
ncbi:MAG: hypothetical protein NMNS01_22900 [Nitrosomonas sp.]|nr:MAG: hypothetical protein NMNS01_22900 [Nitrosomonas sp.]